MSITLISTLVKFRFGCVKKRIIFIAASCLLAGFLSAEIDKDNWLAFKSASAQSVEQPTARSATPITATPTSALKITPTPTPTPTPIPTIGTPTRMPSLIVVNSAEGTLSQDGGCTLPEAIHNANKDRASHADCNAGFGADTIQFNIPGPGPHTINIQKGTRMVVTAPLTIDGLSQKGNGVSPPSCGKKRNLLIELSGLSAGKTPGFLIQGAENVTIRGLVINQFGGSGIQVNGSKKVWILCNHIGTDLGGKAAKPNKVTGILVSNNSQSVTVGAEKDSASSGFEYNVISGNGSAGIMISRSSKNVIVGNRIGTDLSGLKALPNARHGIMVSNSSHSNRIGLQDLSSPHQNNPYDRNIISGNKTHGITISDPGSKHNMVVGNYIGVDITGVNALPNQVAGINIANGAANTTIGGSKEMDMNIISGNRSGGIWIHSVYAGFVGGAVTADTLVQGNLIGQNRNGEPLGNNNQGIRLELAANTQILDNIVANSELRGIYAIGAEATLINNRIINNGRSGIEITFHGGSSLNANDETQNSDDVISSIRAIGNLIDGNCSNSRRCAGIMGIDDSVNPGDTTKGKRIARSNIIKKNNGRPDVMQYWYASVEGLPDMAPYTDSFMLTSSYGRASYRVQSTGNREKHFDYKVLYGPAGFSTNDVTTWQLFPDFQINEAGVQGIYIFESPFGKNMRFHKQFVMEKDYTRRGFSKSGIYSHTHIGYKTANNGFSLLRYKILKLQDAVNTNGSDPAGN